MLTLNEKGISEYRLKQIKYLSVGGHSEPNPHGLNAHRAMCVMEAVSYICNLDWSDCPSCVDESLIAFGIWINDNSSDDQRQALIPLVPKLVGTEYDLDQVKQRRAVRFYEAIRNVFWPKEIAILHKQKRILPDAKQYYDAHIFQQHGEAAAMAINHRLIDLNRRRDILEDVRYHSVQEFPPEIYHIQCELDYLEPIRHHASYAEAMIEPRFDGVALERLQDFRHANGLHPDVPERMIDDALDLYRELLAVDHTAI